MTEATFPLLGAALVVLVVLPFFALVAKAGLTLIERDGTRGSLHHVDVRYVLLTASSAIPLAWLFSAAVHQAEIGRSVLACLLVHEQGAAHCVEPALFAGVIASTVLAAWVRVVRHAGDARGLLPSTDSHVASRIEALVGTRGSLARLRARVVVTDEPGFAIATRGLLRPRVFVGAAFARSLTDDMLASALGHENEHVGSFDPLRYLLLELALDVNPFGRTLLAPHAARWKAAREAHCDREAVIHGAAPLSLADAIVRAARPIAPASAGLGTGDLAVVKLRVGMLLAFAERLPAPCCEKTGSAMSATLALLSFTLLLPHQTSTAALDVLHRGAERLLACFL